MKNKLPIFLPILFLSLLFVSCNRLDELFPREEEPVEDAIECNIELPAGYNFDLSTCTVSSLLDEVTPSPESFNLEVIDTVNYQSVFLTDENDDILMMSFVRRGDEDLTFSAGESALSLMMVLMNGTNLSYDEWDAVVKLIKANENFPGLVAEVENLIRKNESIVSEDNDKLLEYCALIFDDIVVFDETPGGKSGVIVPDIEPLVISTNGTGVSIKNNGKAPWYEIKQFRGDQIVDTKMLEASTPIKMSIGNIITWQWGGLIPSDPVDFSLNDEGNYNFTASSGDLNDPFSMVVFRNMFSVCYNVFAVTGIPIGKECAGAIVSSSISRLVAVVITLKDMNGKPRDGVRAIVDIMLGVAKEMDDIVEECAGADAEKLGNHLKKALVVAKYALKFADILAKAEAITNATYHLGFWITQPSNISFCMENIDDNIDYCRAPFNAISIDAMCPEGFIHYDNGWVLSSLQAGDSYLKPYYTEYTQDLITITAKEGEKDDWYDNEWRRSHLMHCYLEGNTIVRIEGSTFWEDIYRDTVKSTLLYEVYFDNLSIPIPYLSNNELKSIQLDGSELDVTRLREVYHTWDAKNKKLRLSYQTTGYDVNTFRNTGKARIFIRSN